MTYLKQFSPINKWAHWMALASVSVGTVFLLIYFIFREEYFIWSGMYYLIAVFWLNCFVLVTVVVAAVLGKSGLGQTSKTVAALLLNIPIAYLFFLIVLAIAS